jgi:hypothetical protein
MKRVDPIMLVVLSIVTFGIYALIWYVNTKDQMNALGAKIPTAWLLIVPIANFFWLWKFSDGVELVTNRKMEGVMAFIMLCLLSVIGMAIVQDSLNKVSGQPVRAYQTPQYTQPTQPSQSPPPRQATPPTQTPPTQTPPTQTPPQYNPPGSSPPPPPPGHSGPPPIPPPPTKL